MNWTKIGLWTAGSLGAVWLGGAALISREGGDPFVTALVWPKYIPEGIRWLAANTSVPSIRTPSTPTVVG